jgi:CysZ protein
MAPFIAGLKDYVQAQRLLFREGLWPLFLVPGILSLFYLPLSMVFGFIFLKDFTRYVHDHWIPEFLQSAITLILLAIFLWIVALYLGFLLFRNVIMILYSPILGFLSEATERVASGRKEQEDAPKFSLAESVRSAVRGTSMSLLTLLFALIGLATSFLIAMVPVVGAILAVILMPLLTLYLAGVGFFDPPLERRQVGIGGTFTYCWRHRGRVFGQGFCFTLLLLIPVLGWFLAPSYGVVAGTLGVVDDWEEKESGRSDGQKSQVAPGSE